MDNKTERRKAGNLIFRLRAPEGPGPHPVVLMLHGLYGDENVMWIFAGRLPRSALILAPRGLYEAKQGGCTWVADGPRFPVRENFMPAVEELVRSLTAEHFPEGDLSRLHVMGFSQGAALAYTFALLHPEQVVSLAGLAGFLPQGLEDRLAARPLAGKHVYIAHGSQDETVPLAQAENAVQAMNDAGAEVSFCADEVGHKLSAGCFRGLEQFFAGISPAGG